MFWQSDFSAHIFGDSQGRGSALGAGWDAGDEAPAHGGRRQELAGRYGIPKEELLDFSANINLLGPPPPALKAIKRSMSEIAYYPQEDAAALSDAAANFLGVFPNQLVMGNGSIELIYWLAVALSPRKVLIVDPTFSEYERACRAAGAACYSHRLNEADSFAFDVESVDPAGYDLVFVCNPNNPTGYLVSSAEMMSLWQRCRAAGAGLVVDEAFIDFVGGEESVLAMGLPEGLFVLRSFTKSFALAGLRLGCLTATADFVARLKKRLPPWSVNVLAAAAGEAALADEAYLERSRRETLQARQKLYREIAALDGIQPLPAEANFMLCRLERLGSAELADRLGRQGILVRDCRSFAGLGDRYIRVAVRSDRDNYHLITALRKALK